jgi:hypothetical protein
MPRQGNDDSDPGRQTLTNVQNTLDDLNPLFHQEYGDLTDPAVRSHLESQRAQLQGTYNQWEQYASGMRANGGSLLPEELTAWADIDSQLEEVNSALELANAVFNSDEEHLGADQDATRTDLGDFQEQPGHLATQQWAPVTNPGPTRQYYDPVHDTAGEDAQASSAASTSTAPPSQEDVRGFQLMMGQFGNYWQQQLDARGRQVPAAQDPGRSRGHSTRTVPPDDRVRRAALMNQATTREQGAAGSSHSQQQQPANHHQGTGTGRKRGKK